MPAPVIRSHIAEGSRDTALGGNGVGARREDLRDAGRAQACLGTAPGRPQSRTSGPNHEHVEGVVRDRVGRPRLAVDRAAVGRTAVGRTAALGHLAPSPKPAGRP